MRVGSKRSWGRVAGIAFLLGVAAWFVAPVAMRGVGGWLVLDEPLRPADAIFVHAGRVPFRELEAASLYRQGLAPEIWVSPTVMSAQSQALTAILPDLPQGARLRRALLEASGVPEAAVSEIVMAPANTTRDELNGVIQEASRRRLESVILITSKAHTRRVRVLWNRIAAGSGIEAIVRPAEGDPFDPEAWWSNTDDSQQVLHELAGLLDALWETGIRPRA